MPTIEFSLTDFCNLVGQDFKLEELHSIAQYAKAEFDGYDKSTGMVKFDCADTNLPYLWSVEGIARIVKGGLGKEKGIPVLPLSDSDHIIQVDPSVKSVRPFIVAFSAKGKPVDEYILKQIIQLQEKLSEGFGRKRRKVAIGIYPLDKITFPITYKTVLPDGIRFTPLEMDKELTPSEILEQHPAGIKYAFTLQDKKQYPLLIDTNKQVLSLPPIINSNNLGRVQEGDQNLFIEMTGTDQEALELCCTIFAYALADRGFEISTVTVKYADTQTTHPSIKTEKIKIDSQEARNILGVDFSEQQISQLLEKARYNVKGSEVEIPPYRLDILHPVDIIEDIAIMYGYDNFPVSPIETHTIGQIDPLIHFAQQAREIMVGFGFTELLSPMLTNKSLLYEKMNCKDFGTIEIKEYMSETYSVVRSWMLPVLMECVSKNKHHEYPQKIFESGLVTVKKGNKPVDYKRLAALYCGVEADYTKMRQIIDLLLNSFGVEYTLEEVEHPSFIPGRVARVFVKGKGIAFVGELHPQVLDNFEVQMPIAAFELNLSELFELK